MKKKSTCNYVGYGINNVDFGVREKKKNCTKFLTCRSIRQIM